MTLRSLLLGCWGSHDWLRERDGKTLILRCQNCSSVHIPDLSPIPLADRGVAYTPTEILGKPICKLKKSFRVDTSPAAVVSPFAGVPKTATARRIK